IQGLNPNQIDGNTSDEIPNPQIDKKLQKIVLRNMVHGPCGTINPKSPCMKDGKCTKMYPRQLISETQTARDGYLGGNVGAPFSDLLRWRGGKYIVTCTPWGLIYRSCSTAWDDLFMFIIMLLFNLEYKEGDWHYPRQTQVPKIESQVTK